MNCKLCGDLTNWSDAYCTHCGLAEARRLVAQRRVEDRRLVAGRRAAPRFSLRERAVFALCWLAGFLLGLSSALAVLGRH